MLVIANLSHCRKTASRAVECTAGVFPTALLSKIHTLTIYPGTKRTASIQMTNEITALMADHFVAAETILLFCSYKIADFQAQSSLQALAALPCLCSTLGEHAQSSLNAQWWPRSTRCLHRPRVLLSPMYPHQDQKAPPWIHYMTLKPLSAARSKVEIVSTHLIQINKGRQLCPYATQHPTITAILTSEHCRDRACLEGTARAEMVPFDSPSWRWPLSESH